MSLYWQQAVQSRGSVPPTTQHHGHSAGIPQAGQWQNSNYVQQQADYWSQEANSQNYQQPNNTQPITTGYYQQPPQPTETSYAQQPQVLMQNQAYTQNVNYGYYAQEEALQPSEVQQYNSSCYSDYSMAPTEQQHLPQVSSLSSIPEFETIDFPAATNLGPLEESAVHQCVQGHPQVATEQITEKPSSQVTPESTYSVDTFNSTYSKEEKKEDLWDDWIQTPRVTVHESSPYAVESTQSEPLPNVQSGASRESTVSLDHKQNGYFDDLQQQQIAPLVKQFPEIDQQPVARASPIHQATTEQNVKNISPTHPLQATAAPILENNREARPIEVGHDSSATRTDINANAAPASTSQEMHSVQDSHYLTAPEQEEPRVTPDSDNLQLESIGEAQATSTPNESVEVARERQQLERRSSVSSIRSGMQQIHATNGDQSDNSTQGSVAFSRGGPRASYQERYKGVKEKYLDSRAAVNQVMRRLDQSRIDTPKLIRGNPLGEISGRRSAIQISSREKRPDSTTYPHEKVNISNYSQADPSLNESIDISTNGAGYGEEFVDASRRSRLNRSRPPSRAKSDIGDDLPYHRSHGPHQRYFDNRVYPVHPQYFGYNMAGRHSGRVSATGISYSNDYYQQQAMMYQRPRPQSTYDARAMERFQRSGGNIGYDAFTSRPEDDEDQSFSDESEIEDEAGESEDEMRTYNMARGVNNSFSSFTMGSQPKKLLNYFGAKESYYFGIIRLDRESINNVFRKLKVPQDFESLKPIQKAAYLYYASIHGRLFSAGIEKFDVVFNREFYKYRSEGDSSDIALSKICKSMFDEYMAKRQNNQQKAYEASQKQLFSDDRDSADGLSDRASVYDREDDRASDILSIDQRAPLKHRSPHAFMNFGRGGKMIILNPEQSHYTVVVDDVRSSLKDNHSRRLIDAAQNFKGPLIPGIVQPHTVLLYIQTQLVRIQNSEVAKENPKSCDVVDCLLLWKLLEIVVKQHGRVTGPDIANLLVSEGYSTSKKANHREKSNTPSQEIIKTVPPDPKAYDIFTRFLLGGHVDEAVKSAVNNGLHADAIILVRRIFAGDEKKLADIEARFLSTRPPSNPVMTLAAVASGQPAPVLTNPPNDDTGSWRSHAAIVLANLHTRHALQTVFELGRVLAKREYHAAADFCFLAVSLLSSFDINAFQKPNVTDEDLEYVSLIHASLPDDDWDSTSCRYGFSLTDLHATEIFDYAIKLSAPLEFISPLQTSIDIQRKRLQYAQLLASLGGFQAESFKYLLSVASAIWSNYQCLAISELTNLVELADSLQLFAEEGIDLRWIGNLREMIDKLKQEQPIHQVSSKEESLEPQIKQEEVPNQAIAYVDNQHARQDVFQEEFTQGMEGNREMSRSRTNSLEIRAHDWHADRQEPIQMSPRGSTSNQFNGRRDSMLSVRRDSVVPTGVEEQKFQSIPENISNQQQTYGEQLCQTQNTVYYQQPTQSDYEYANTTESSMTTSPEASPAKQRNPSMPLDEMPQHHPAYESPPRPQQQFVPQQPNTVPVPSQPPTLPQAPASQPQVNGLKKSNTGSKGFLNSLGQKVRQFIPGKDEMKLPDDKNPSIRWDEKQNKWIGDGVEEIEQTAPPPVAAPAIAQTQTSSSGGLRAARGGGGSRYLNPLANSNNVPSNLPTGGEIPVPPQLQPQLTFNFIPSMPDDADSVDPFSGEANPTVHGLEQTGPQ